MSVDHSVYLIYGVVMVPGNLPDHEDFHFINEEQPYADEGVVMIYDGMSGEYVVFGHIGASIDRYGELDAENPVNIRKLQSAAILSGDQDRWKQAIMKIFARLDIPVDSVKAHWHLLSHFS